MRVGNRIHELRGTTPLRLIAARADLPETSVSRVAAGDGPGPLVATALKIARALRRPIGELFYAVEDESPAALAPSDDGVAETASCVF